MDSAPPRLILQIDRAEGVAEIRVNGRLAGVRPWPPYRVDVSGMLHAGKNRVEIMMAGSMGNFLRASYGGRISRGRSPEGILGRVTLRQP